eukprot:snap_masked-scaffold_40-processed-gene-2.39-mRNA-1 protein AED:1.00 eAED:1.00 QI:0/-1/0/0/-1/1/1/0/319
MSDGYMTLVFPSGMDEPFLSLFEDAQDYWNAGLLSSGIGSVDLGGSSVPSGCLITYTFPSPFVVNGAVLLAEFASIDGSGSILAQAGVCTFDNNLPRLGVMQFDTADSQSLLDGGNFGEVIRHEMAHSFGLGSAWTNFGLVSTSCFFGICFGGSDYLGANGNEGLADLGGSGSIQVELDGGAGTAGAHWDETTYEQELMTGYLNSGVFNPASIMTIKSFIDMGYEVDLSVAESYTLPKQAFTGEKIQLGADMIDLGYRETSDWLENGDSVTVHTRVSKSTVEFAVIGVALAALAAFVAAMVYKKSKKVVETPAVEEDRV